MTQPAYQETRVNRAKPRRRVKPKLVAQSGERILEGEAASSHLLEATRRFRSQQERRQLVEGLARRPGPGDSTSMRIAMQSVERQIVKAVWVIEISGQADGPRKARQHGLGYMLDAIDHWADAIAKGGFQMPTPKPAVPSAREIEAAKRAKRWIEWLDEGQAKLLNVAALTKRGDRERRVNWDFVKTRLRLPDGTPNRTLQDRYDRALRWIVAELSIAHD